MNLVLILISAYLLGFIQLLIHELTHFIVAKRAGMIPDEFTLGVGPKIFSKNIFTLNAFPIKGYVGIRFVHSGDTKKDLFKFHLLPLVIELTFVILSLITFKILGPVILFNAALIVASTFFVGLIIGLFNKESDIREVFSRLKNH